MCKKLFLLLIAIFLFSFTESNNSANEFLNLDDYPVEENQEISIKRYAGNNKSEIKDRNQIGSVEFVK